ncbi:MAG: hypothetical protein ABIP94_10585, partial [Planctomycetota bacterium]
MQLRSSVESTRPFTSTSPITKWKHWLSPARIALATLALIVSAGAHAGSFSTITVVSGNNQSGTTGTVLPDPLTVQYNDMTGVPIAGGSLIFTVTSGDAVFTSNGATQATISADSMGMASQQVQLGSIAGPVTVEVTDFFSTPPAVFNLTAVASPSITVVSGNDQTGATGSVLPDPLTVEYLDGAGGAIAGGSLIYTVTSGDAFFVSNGSTQVFTSSDAAGRAMQQVQLGSTVGPVTVEVTDFGTTPPAVFNLTAVGPNNSISVVSGDGQSANVGQPFAAPLVVELRDGAGMLPDGVPVTFQITAGDARFDNGQFSIVSNTAGGRVQASLVAGPTQGNVSIVIRASGYSDAFANAYVNNPGGTGALLVVSGSGQQTTVNTPFVDPLVVRVDDGVPRQIGRGPGSGVNGSVPDVTVTFTVQSGNALFPNGLNSIDVVSDSGGLAQVFVDATSPEGDVVIAITAVGFRGTSARMLIVGANGNIVEQSGGGQRIAPADTTPLPLVSQVQDSSAQPVPGVTV